MLVVDAVSSYLNIPSDLVLRLIWFGAVYCCKVVPLPAASIDTTLKVQIMEWRQEGLVRHGKNSQLSYPQRVMDTTQSFEIKDGQYFRVHCHPKRFPVAKLTDWKSRIIFDAADFVVVDKPPGIQVPPTVDNLRESLLAKVEEALGGKCTLTPPHRLDVGTSGVVFLSKNHRFSSYFQKQVLANKLDNHLPTMKKRYKCLVSTPPPSLGSLVHYLLLGQGGKGEPQHTICLDQPLLGPGGEELTARAELIILSVREIKLGKEGIQVLMQEEAFEVEILLITGRTHQIRAQLAAIGCPLMGDELYQVVARRAIAAQLKEGSTVAASSEDFRRIQEDPLRPFALQSSRSEVFVDAADAEGMELMGGSHRVFDSSPPWWSLS
jgi:23S rRNA-/tRNA-specific pseudouridylate synthase